MRILVVCVSRGRPGAAQQMWASMQTTVGRADTQLLIAVDDDDPTVHDYLRLPETDTTRRFGIDIDRPWVRVLPMAQTGDMVKAINSAVAPFADQPLIIGVVNDDQRFRTRGWDRRVTDVLATSGIAYGNDLFQGEALVTSPFITSDIVRALGWYALPTCEHLFVDNAWGDIGRGIDRLTYLPDVVVEHLHPLAGKGEWDEGYERANNQRVTDHDRIAYEAWRDGGGRIADVARVRASLDQAVAA